MDLGVQFVHVDIDKLRKEQKKQKKKEKKEKKRLRKEARHSHTDPAVDEQHSASNSGTSDCERTSDQSERRASPSQETKPSRDSWLTEKAGRNILTGQLNDPSVAENKAHEVHKPSKVRELKPGLSTSDPKKERGKPSTVGDGGASWRLKALKRAEAQAEEEGSDLKVLVSERFGSLSTLTDGLMNNRSAHPKAHLHAFRERQGQREGPAPESAAYLRDVSSGQGKMRRPDSTASLSWRKKASSKDQIDARASEEAPKRGHRSQHGAEQAELDNDGARKASDRMPLHGGRGNGDASRLQDRQRENPTRQRRDPAIMKGAAVALNKFDGDGSFLEKFQAHSVGGQLSSGQAADRVLAADMGSSMESDAPETATPASLEPSAVAGDPVDGNNRTAAAALRARLMGKSSASHGAPASERKAVASQKSVDILPSVDMQGRAVPGAFGRDSAGEGQIDGGRKVKKLQRFEGGQKQRNFADDDNKSLDVLVREQRHGGGRDMDANLAENIARKAKFRERDLDVDEEYDVDGGLEMYENRNSKVTKEKAVKRQRTSQIADLRKLNNALDNCNLCFGSARLSKHLIAALGQTVYLSIPERGRLAPLHCCIVPMEHISSSRKTDEHVWTEMRNFKKCIIQTYMAEGMNAVFMETAMRLTDRRSHAIVHCIPLDDQAFQRAPIVFKKALDEAESEWSQHHSKAAIDTRAKGLCGSIPPNFPYFFVEFGLSAGYVHVVDDEEKFDKDFGRSIVAGLLGLGAETQHRGARAEPLAVQKKLLSDFASKFDPYDWTKQLN